MTNCEAEIRKFIAEKFLFGDDSKLENEESLLEAGIVDSTGILELINHIEDRYGIKVGDDELVPENLDSIFSIAAFLGRKTGRAA